MQNYNLTIVDLQGNVKQLSFDPTNNLVQLRASISATFKIQHNTFDVVFNGKVLTDDFLNLIQLKIGSGDLLSLSPRMGSQTHPVQPQRQSNFGSDMVNQQAYLMQEAQALRNKFLSNEAELNMLLERDPQMAEAILSEDIQETVAFIIERKRQIAAQKQQKVMEDMALNANPFDVEAQKKIEERIRLERHNKDMEYVHENMPESFIQTTMLYIPMEVNGKDFQAFIDSGAQSTIMSRKFVERCGLLKDVDTRYKGMAVGVGQTEIIGRIHRCKLNVGGHEIECSITVLNQDGMGMLFGLDMLKKHRCCINLLDNCLEFKNAGFSVPFVADHKIDDGLIQSRVFD